MKPIMKNNKRLFQSFLLFCLILILDNKHRLGNMRTFMFIFSLILLTGFAVFMIFFTILNI